jgi:thiol:disulfide interchange protein DsbA
MLNRASILVVCALALCAALRAEVLPNRDYLVLDPAQPTDSPGKIEVIEFFSYGCPHCNEFYPLVSAWAAKLPKDVVFKRVPAAFGRPAWANLAKTYYALQHTGDLTRLDGALFHAIHEEHLPLWDEQHIAEWVGKQGVNAQAFSRDFESMGVDTQLTHADQMIEAYKVEGIPTMAVDGRFVVIGSSFEDMLANTDQVIAKVRAENKQKSGVQAAQKH